MPSSASLPYDWLKQIPTALLQLDEIPLIGFAPSFPWEELSKDISETFQIEDFKITPSPLEWVDKDHILASFGKEISIIHCTLPPLDGELFFVLSKDELKRLMSLILNDKEHEKDLLEDEFLSGFYYFSTYKIIHSLNKLPFGKNISPQINMEGPLPNEDCLSMNLEIQIRGVKLIARVLISQNLRRSWKEKYAERSLEIPISSNLAEKLSIPVSLEVGKFSLLAKEWNQLNAGDFLLIDNCSINPEDTSSGRVTLYVNNIPFFIGKLKDGNIKLLDHPLYKLEDNISMAKKISETDSHEEDSSFDLSSETSEFDSHFDSEMESEIENDEETEIEETNESEIENESSEQEDETANEEQSLSFTTNEHDESPLKIEEVPLSISIELGRIQMSIKKIMDLQPGNLLELNLHPENGVDLVVNGSRVAKGELVKLGDVLGVRILDIS